MHVFSNRIAPIARRVAAASLTFACAFLPSTVHADVPATPIALTAPAASTYDMFPDAVALPGSTGGFVMAYTRSVTAPATHSLRLRQFTNRGVAAKPEVIVTAPALAKGLRPKMAAVSATRIAIVWQSGVDVFGQFYDVTLNKMVGAAVRLGEADDLIHDVVRLSNGTLAVVHMDDDFSNLANLREKVSVSIFNGATFARISGPVSMHGLGHALDASNAFDHSIVDAASGGIVFLRDRANGKLMMRRFAANGQPVGVLVQVNSTPLLKGTVFDSTRFEVKAERLANGNTAIVWSGLETTGANGQEVRLRVLKADGNWAGPDVRVNVATVGAQTAPDIVEQAASAFSVVWVSDPDVFNRGLFARKFSSLGAPSSAPLQTEAGFSFSLTPDTKPVRLGDGSVAHVLGGFISFGDAGKVKAEGFRQ
jgi:hypothetical protein